MRFPSYCGDRDRRDSWGHGIQVAHLRRRVPRGGAVRIVTETGKPIPEVAGDLGIHAGTLHSWVSRARRNGSPSSARPVAEASRGVARGGGWPRGR
ncbi:transposase [Streptomyces sp. NPDC000348]|uniref:transposase n=1 Tax=Streptomyces sp. NPDC000348 TaxID=3364538 RepID=UPI0036AFBE65